MSPKNTRRKHLTPTRLALAVGAAMLVSSPAGWGSVTLDGYFYYDGGDLPAGWDKNFIAPTNTLTLAGFPGSFIANGGSRIDLARLNLGARGEAHALIDGGLLLLRGNGYGSRLEVGHNAAKASLTVSFGGVVDGRVDAEACLLGPRYCFVAIGSSAGSDATFTVTGHGSRASFLGSFNVGGVHVDTPVNFGDPGGTTTGRVSVLAGGLLEVDSANLGNSNSSIYALGTERSIATAKLDRSTWRVTGSSFDEQGAVFTMATGARSSADVDVDSGSRLEVSAAAGRYYDVRVGNGGEARMLVRSGSTLSLSGDRDRGTLNIGEGGGTGWLRVEGASTLVGSNRWVQVGLNGGYGEFQVTGARSSASFTEMTDINVGNSATGLMVVEAGAGVSAGTLNIGVVGGTGSVLLSSGAWITLSKVDSHRLSVGAWGTGSLTISGGAVLDATGNAAACANRWCGSFVGQEAGSEGHFTVTGSGSQASFLGDFNIGQVNLARPPLQSWVSGTPGGTTRASVQVLEGGVLNTERVNVGGWLSASGNGNEQSFSTMVVRGAGSVWRVTGSTLDAYDTYVGDATQVNAHTQWTIDQGGLLHIEAPTGRSAGLYLGSGGQSQMTVDGKGSLLVMTGERTTLSVGAFSDVAGQSRLTLSNGAELRIQPVLQASINVGERGGSGSLNVLSGSQISGVQHLVVGVDRAWGEMMVAGAGSKVSVTSKDANQFTGVQVGRGFGSTGYLAVSGGGLLEARVLELGRTVGSTGHVLISAKSADGEASKITLSASNQHRLYIGSGELTVAAGGVLDGRVDAAACSAEVWCGTLVGAHAGSTANLTVTGAGSRASLLGDLQVARAWVATQATDGYTEGEAGGTVMASVNVLNGGLLQTDRVSVGMGSYALGATGEELAQAQLLVRGPGSTWQVTGGTGAALFSTVTGNASNAHVNALVSAGGQLQLLAPTGFIAQMNLSALAGHTDFKVTGAGSTLLLQSDVVNQLNVASNGGSAMLSFSDGARLLGGDLITVGNSNGMGTLNFDGAGTTGQLIRHSTLTIGRNGGQGQMNIRNGAVVASDASTQQALLYVGRGSGDSGGSGVLSISGAGSALNLHTAAAVEGVPSEALFNPRVIIGDQAHGVLRISAGGRMTISGDVPRPVGGAARYTQLNVGGYSTNGGTGLLSVTGTGSSLAVLGQDAVIWVGNGSTGMGQMQVLDGARVDSTLLHLGSIGGTGSLKLDAAEIHLNGQWSSADYGAALVLGKGVGSVGTAQLSRGAKLLISNPGSAGVELNLGGTTQQLKGTGVLNLSGGSQIKLEAGVGLATASIGHSGVGTATLEGRSRLDVGDGSLYIGQRAGAVGTLTLAGNSSVTAGYVGVGSTPGADTGVGTLIINNSTVSAATIEIGAHGYVGGNGTLVGKVINRGIFSPGNSPGTLVIDGSFTNLAGGQLVLEIEADGLGGFKTDQLVFTNPAAVDLAGLAISFRFLGQTDPNAFQAGGAFKIDEFIQLQGGGELDHAQFAAVSFSASADAYAINSFSFSADGGASFSATPVPEPGSWMLLLAGLGVLGATYRMKRDRSSLRASSPSLASTSAAPMATV